MAVNVEDIALMVRDIQKYIGPSVPRIEAEKAIYAALNEIEQHRIIADDEEYQTNITQGSDIISISSPSVDYGYSGVRYLSYEETPLTAKNEQWLDQNDYGWRHAPEGQPLYYFMTTRSLGQSIVLRTNRKPAETIANGYTYQPTLISKPVSHTGTANKILTWYREYGEAVEFGAAGRLLTQPKRKWSDTKLGSYYLKKFNQMKQEILSQARRGNTNSSVSVKLPRWA